MNTPHGHNELHGIQNRVIILTYCSLYLSGSIATAKNPQYIEHFLLQRSNVSIDSKYMGEVYERFKKVAVVALRSIGIHDSGRTCRNGEFQL